MKSRVIEKHWTEHPVISYINYEYEYDTIPLIKRTLYKKFLWFWIPVKSQTIRQILNDYIHSCSFGTQWSYDNHWKSELLKVDKSIYL